MSHPWFLHIAILWLLKIIFRDVLYTMSFTQSLEGGGRLFILNGKRKFCVTFEKALDFYS